MPSKEIELLKWFKAASSWSIDLISKGIGVHHQTVQAWLTGKKEPGNLSRKAIREFLAKSEGQRPYRVMAKESVPRTLDGEGSGAGLDEILYGPKAKKFRKKEDELIKVLTNKTAFRAEIEALLERDRASIKELESFIRKVSKKSDLASRANARDLRWIKREVEKGAAAYEKFLERIKE